FSKFINRKSPAAVKEEIRQERKLMKKERREGIEKHFEEKRNKRPADIPNNPGPHAITTKTAAANHKLNTAGTTQTNTKTGNNRSQKTGNTQSHSQKTGNSHLQETGNSRSQKVASQINKTGISVHPQ